MDREGWRERKGEGEIWREDEKGRRGGGGGRERKGERGRREGGREGRTQGKIERGRVCMREKEGEGRGRNIRCSPHH